MSTPAPAPAPRTWRYFAHRTPEGIRHIFQSRMQVQMCGDYPVVEVSATEDPDGEWWAWLELNPKYATGEPVMVWGSEVQLDICFPGGYQFEVDRGEGVVVRLNIVEVPGVDGQ